MTVKVVVIGDSTVGKSSVVMRYAYDTFGTDQMPTIGAAVISKRVNNVTLNIWDTAGQERYKSLASLYYRGAQIALVMYDITNRHSFNSATTCLSSFKMAEPNAIVALVGNKIDLDAARCVEHEEGSRFSEETGSHFFEVSALQDRVHIDNMFVTLIGKLSLPDEVDQNNVVLMSRSSASSRSHCC
jgi:small GTP-binding protein